MAERRPTTVPGHARIAARAISRMQTFPVHLLSSATIQDGLFVGAELSAAALGPHDLGPRHALAPPHRCVLDLRTPRVCVHVRAAGCGEADRLLCSAFLSSHMWTSPPHDTGATSSQPASLLVTAADLNSTVVNASTPASQFVHVKCVRCDATFCAHRRLTLPLALPPFQWHPVLPEHHRTLLCRRKLLGGSQPGQRGAWRQPQPPPARPGRHRAGRSEAPAHPWEQRGPEQRTLAHRAVSPTLSGRLRCRWCDRPRRFTLPDLLISLASVLDGLDFFVAEIGKRGMRATMVLGDEWPWSGGHVQLVSWADQGCVPEEGHRAATPSHSCPVSCNEECGRPMLPPVPPLRPSSRSRTPLLRRGGRAASRASRTRAQAATAGQTIRTWRGGCTRRPPPLTCGARTPPSSHRA